jgi:hypothetical protein
MVADLEAREAQNDPPTLWSIEVVNETSGGRPVFICANRRIVSGFSSIIPGDGIVNCARDVDIKAARERSQFRCELKGVTYAVSSAVVGDPKQDFSVSSSAYPLTDGGTDYARTLRFRRRGACPKGWKIGEATTQNGARTMAY